MTTKAEKKNAIRQDIIEAAKIYSQNLAGKVFLYVYGEEYFEVSFPVENFLHLTGVETGLSAKNFTRMQRRLSFQISSSILIQGIHLRLQRRSCHA